MLGPVVVSRFLSDDDDGVSEAINSFAVQYIGILKVRRFLVRLKCMHKGLILLTCVCVPNLSSKKGLTST